MRANADFLLQASVRELQSGENVRALAHSTELLAVLARLRDAEPEDTEHRFIEAEAQYNHAAILDRVGRSAEATEAARAALNLYLELGAPTTARELHALDLAAIISPAQVTKVSSWRLALLAADAQARLARLTARTAGAAALSEIRRLGQAAIQMYTAARETNPEHDEGLRRVAQQYATAMDTLARARWVAGDARGATRLYQEALDECLRCLGPRHPVTVMIHAALDRVRAGVDPDPTAARMTGAEKTIPSAGDERGGGRGGGMPGLLRAGAVALFVQAVSGLFVAVALLFAVQDEAEHGGTGQATLMGLRLLVLLGIAACAAATVCAVLTHRRYPWVRSTVLALESVTLINVLFGLANGQFLAAGLGFVVAVFVLFGYSTEESVAYLRG
ncbi:tetratricopeptide repeat protein [Parafrankia elaeagni]|uniref:tetratricopeptide repeat protein n=1 Tax=Parafrankia elaeagni TaxID=222534 RepID=UPI00036C14C5|nr:tetratricopeptide repeat protein [Parafrankia elaeagni]